jgi:hypothetical protein
MPHQCTACGRVFADGSKEMLSGCPDCGGNKFQYRPPGAAGGADGDAEAGGGTGATPDAGSANEADAAVEPDGPPGSDPRDGDGNGDDSADGPALPGAHRETGSPGIDDGRAPGSPAGPDSTTADRADRPDATGGGESTPHAGSTTPGTDGDVDDDSRSAAARAGAAVKDLVGLGSDDDPGAADAGSESGGVPAEDRAQADARSGVVDPDEIAAAADAGSGRAADADETAPPSEPDRATGSRVVEPDSEERPSVDELRKELNDQFESIRILNPGQYELNLMELYNRDEYIISLREDGRYVIEVADSWRSPDEE